MKKRGRPPKVKNGSTPSITLNDINAEMNSNLKEVDIFNGKGVIKTTKKPKKLVKMQKESANSKITPIGTVNHKKKKKVLPSNSHQQMKLDGNSKIVDTAVVKAELSGLPKLKLKLKPQKTISKTVKKQKCYSVKKVAVFVKNKQKQTSMELSNSAIENETVSDNDNSSHIEDRIQNVVELDQEQTSPIIKSNYIKNKFEKLKMNKKSLVSDKESHQKETNSESCTTSHDQMTELYYRSLGLVPTNSIFPRKRKIVPEQKCQTNSNSVIAQQGNNFKIIVNVDTKKLTTDVEQPIQERHDSTDLKTVNRNSSYTDVHNEASKDEELQPVNKKIHVAHVEKAIDDAEKTYSSVTDEIIQNSVAEKDNSAIKSPPPRVLQKRKASDASCIEETINYVVKTYSTEPSDRLCMKQNSAIKHSYVHLENAVVNRDLQQTYNLNKKVYRKNIKNKHRDVKKMNSNSLNSSVYSKTDMANPSNTISSTASSLQCARKLAEEIKNNSVNENNTFTVSKSLSSKPYSTKTLQSEPSTNILSNCTSLSNSTQADLILCQQETSLNEPDRNTANTQHLKSNNNSVSRRSNSSNSSSNSSLNFSNFIDSLQEGSCRRTSVSSTPSPSVLDISANTHYQDTQFTTIADNSTSSSDSSAVLNTSADGISSKNEMLTNMADSSTNAIESDVLVHNYNIVPALLNIKITRNIAANSDDRIIQLIPQPKCSNLQENDCSSKPTFILDYRGYEVDETFDDEDDSYKDWPLFYNFTTEEAIRILSHDNIFKGAVLSSIPEHEITSSLTYTITNRLPISNKNIRSPVNQEKDTAAECNSNRAEQFKMGSHFTIPSIEREDSSSHRTSSIISADNETVVSQQNFKFKTPMLPPAKRPPTRLKSCTSGSSSRSRSPAVSELSFSTLSVSNNSDTSGSASRFAESLIIKNRNDSHIQDNEDAISLYAGTIKGSDVDDYLPSTENLKEEEDNPPHIEDTSSGNNVQLRPTPLIELPKQPVTLPKSDIIKWIASGEKWIASGEEAIKSNPKKSRPAVFNKLCYYYFARDRCKKAYFSKCTRRHMLPVDAAEQIKNLTQEELLDAYNFTLDKYKLYAQTIHYFIKTFQERKCTSNVLSMVNDIMSINMFDRTPLINEIIKTLQAMDMSFCLAVERIAAQQAPNIVLLDILLYIICDQHKDELIKNWYLVRKLIQYRSCHHIDHHLLEDIITECCCNKNKDLCKNVIKDIISQGLVELQKVSVIKINDFLSLLRSLELEDEERVLIDVMKQYNIIMQNTRLTSTPPLTLAENRLTTQNDLQYRNVSTEQLLQNESVISNEHNKNMRNSVDENPQQFSDCQKSDDTGVHKDTETPTTSNTQYMWSKHNDGNISNFKTDSKDYYDTTWAKNVNLPNSSSHALQFDMDEYQGKHISRELNLVSQNIEIGSSTVSDNNIKSNVCEDFSLTQNGIFGTDRQMAYQINSPDNLNVVSDRSSLISHHSNSNNITNPDVTNNMRMQYIHEPEINSTSSSSTSIASFHSDDMLDSTETSLEDSQVKILSDIILSTEFRIMDFLAMFNVYKDTPLKDTFIVNIIGFFKRKTPTEMYNMCVQVLTGLQQQGSAYMNDENTESMLHMLIVNIVAVLDQERSFEKAAQLLVKFYTNLKRLTQTKWLRSIHKHRFSEVGKYLHFCRIFVKGGYLKEAVDILMAPDLRLLYGSNMWTLKCNENFDTELRNFVLQDLIEVTLRINIPLAKRVILQLITDKNHITEIEIWRHFNSLILNMLNSNDTYMDDLKEILPNVLQGWYRHLTKPVMRGLLVQLVVSDVPDSELIKLYKKCCKQKIYQPIKGTEEKLVLRTDMKHEEIYMTVHYLFTKIAKCNFPLHEITLNIKLSDSMSSHPKVLFNSDVSVSSLKTRVYNVLACSFQYAIHVQKNENEPYIRISPDEIRPCINYYKKSTPNSFWVRQLSVEQMQDT